MRLFVRLKVRFSLGYSLIIMAFLVVTLWVVNISMSSVNTVRHPVVLVGDVAYEVNASESKPLYSSQVKKIIERMEKARQDNQKLCVVIFVLHCQEYSVNNQLWSKTIKKLAADLKDHYGKECIRDYVCSRERDKSDAQHYHLALLLDGRLVNKKYTVEKKLSNLWLHYGGSKITHIKTYNIPSTNQHLFELAIYHLSYFAKVRSKERRDKSTRNFFVRHIKTV